MIVIPFSAQHLTSYKLHESQSRFSDLIQNHEYLKQLEESSITSLSFIDERSSRVIYVAGLVDCGFGRVIAWAFSSKYAKKYMGKITRVLIPYFTGYDRVELITDSNFPEHGRWAIKLGFTKESDMVNYFGKNNSAEMYVRI